MFCLENVRHSTPPGRKLWPAYHFNQSTTSFNETPDAMTTSPVPAILLSDSVEKVREQLTADFCSPAVNKVS